MNIHFSHLELNCRNSVERVDFSPQVTFIHGPVSTGKSTTARLIDFCFGGRLERTPALRNEFLAANLSVQVGDYFVVLEREASQSNSVRVTWEKGEEDKGSLLAPLQAGADPILPGEVFTLSDLLFYFSGTSPIKVRKSKRDPDSELVRLSFRDVMWYCYLQQDILDSSFFRMGDPFKRNKSIDVMRFVVGLHSDRLNTFEQDLAATQDRLRANKIAAIQIREFLQRFQLGSGVNIEVELQEIAGKLNEAIARRKHIESHHLEETHAADPLREHLRTLTRQIGKEEDAQNDLRERIYSQKALRAELVGAKVKASRSESAQSVLSGVCFCKCPQCGSDVASKRFDNDSLCSLCGQNPHEQKKAEAIDLELLRTDLNTRIDDLDKLTVGHERELEKQVARVQRLREEKRELDGKLTQALQQYDSAYVSQVRGVDREIAELEERRRQLNKLAKLPNALEEMQEQAGVLEGKARNLKSAIEDERRRLKVAEARIRDIESAFLATMLEIGFPGISPSDRVEINRRNWLPRVYHGDSDEQGWDFDDAGSGGKRVLFNVCYALAIHKVAAEHKLPLPTFLIVDSPTKNISPDVNPDLIAKYFRLIYSLAEGVLRNTQFLLIDSDLVSPDEQKIDFKSRLMSTDCPLISYYNGP